MNRTLAITSGKGGVGKTNIGLNLALYLSHKGYRTCLFDADFGLANINILLGLHPEYDLKDVILKGMKLSDIIIPTFNGVHILPGSSGLEEMANLQSVHVERLIRSLSEMEGYDFTLFDTAAGISRMVITLCLASPEVILIITPEPTSLTDSFSLLKVLSVNDFKGEIKIIVNECNNANTATLIYKKFHSAAKKFLGMEIKGLGLIYHDNKVIEAVKEQRPFFLEYPRSKASRCISAIGDRLMNNTSAEMSEPMRMSDFWKKCFRLINSPLRIPGAKKSEKKHDTGDEQEPPPVHEEKLEGQKPPGPEEKTTAQEAPEPEQAPDETPVSEEEPGNRAVPHEQIKNQYVLSLKVLNQNIESVSTEIRGLKDAIKELGVSLSNRIEENKSSSSGMVNRKPITLDLEGFLKKVAERKGG